MRLDRRHLLAGALGLSCAGYARWVEPQWFDLTYTKVKIRGAGKLRILHISDLHVSDGTEPADLARAVSMGLSTQPGLVLFTGDYVSDTSGFDTAALQRIVSVAAAQAPCYGVMGNHDGGRWLHQFGGLDHSGKLREIVESAGLRVLHNRNTIACGLQLVGVGDLWSEEFEEEKAFAGARADLPTLLLCHNPDGKDRLAGYRWNLMLSGHTHGGQVRVDPFPALWAPVADKRYLAGLHTWQGRQLYISRGTGSPKHVRFACRPEIAVLDIEPAEAAGSIS